MTTTTTATAATNCRYDARPTTSVQPRQRRHHYHLHRHRHYYHTAMAATDGLALLASERLVRPGCASSPAGTMSRRGREIAHVKKIAARGRKLRLLSLPPFFSLPLSRTCNATLQIFARFFLSFSFSRLLRFTSRTSTADHDCH